MARGVRAGAVSSRLRVTCSVSGPWPVRGCLASGRSPRQGHVGHFKSRNGWHETVEYGIRNAPRSARVYPMPWRLSGQAAGLRLPSVRLARPKLPSRSALSGRVLPSGPENMQNIAFGMPIPSEREHMVQHPRLFIASSRLCSASKAPPRPHEPQDRLSQPRQTPLTRQLTQCLGLDAWV